MTNWRGLEDEQKAQIAIELFVELLDEVETQQEIMGELSEFWTEKDVKAMKRTLGFLTAYYGLSSLD
jgi:hypothetical protein